ncbi:MAG: hypothetical protein WBD20_06710 [Pirellulaceae bacterium]
MSLRAIFPIFVGCVVALGSNLLAQDTEIKYPVDTKTLKLKITCDGKAVEGVEVRLYACRCEENRGAHYSWPRNNTDAKTSLTSDADGVVTIEYPVKFGEPSNWLTISQISMAFTHSQYVPAEMHIDPREGDTEKELKLGCELSFSATDPDRQPVEVHAVIAGPGRSAKWVRDDDQTIRSRAIPDGSWQTILVSPRENGRHLFSGVLPVRLADQQDVKLRNLRLKPGLRITGHLSENVPRPVKNGRIEAYCLPKPAGRTWGDEDPSVSWTETVNVQADGSFDFLSLPRSGVIQFLCVCDGWVSVDDGFEKPAGTFKQGLLTTVADLDTKDDYCDNLVLQMEPTGKLQVTVTGPDGKPLEGARISTNPNQYSHLAGSTVLGHFSRSIKSFVKDLPDLNDDSSLFSGMTDKNGKVTLKGIPLIKNYQVGAYHDDYLMPEVERGRRKRVGYTCKAGEATEVTIEMIDRPASE